MAPKFSLKILYGPTKNLYITYGLQTFSTQTSINKVIDFHCHIFSENKRLKKLELKSRSVVHMANWEEKNILDTHVGCMQLLLTNNWGPY